MFCLTCGARLQPGDRFCGGCGTAQPPAEPARPRDAGEPAAADPARTTDAGEATVVHAGPVSPAEPPASSGHGDATRRRVVLVAAVVLLLTTIGVGLGWVSTRRQLESVRSAQAKLEADVARLAAERDALATPVIGSVRVHNANVVSGRLNVLQEGGPFDQAAVHYIGYAITGPNQSFGIRDVAGTLRVKYLRPDRSVLRDPQRSPEGFTGSSSISIPKTLRTWQASGSWGHGAGNIFGPGVWWIEWWWDDRKIGDAAFRINPGFSWPFRTPAR